jgi:hypothetical protein
MRRKANFVTLVFITSMSASMIGRSQPRDNPIERARHYMELGQESFRAGKFNEAAEQFADAYAASPYAAFLYNAGLAYERHNAAGKAAEMYRRYLNVEPNATDAPEIEVKIRALLAMADSPPEAVAPEPSSGASVQMKSLISVRTNPVDAKVRILNEKGVEVPGAGGPVGLTVERGVYTIEASHPDFRTVQTDISVVPGQVFIVVVEMSQGAFLGFVHITTDVPGASVYVGDRAQGQVGVSPWGGILPAGQHKIIVERPGYKLAEKEVNVELGGQHEIEFVLERLDFGQLLVKANVPGAMVLVDGQLLGAAPIDEAVQPGKRSVVVKASKMKDYETQVDIGGGQQTKLLVRMNPKPSRTSAWVSAGVSLALVAGGAVCGGLSLGIRNDLERERNRGTLASNDPRMTKGFVLALGADVGFGVALVTGLTSLYYFLRDPLPPSEGKASAPEDLDRNPVQSTPKVSLAPIIHTSAAGLGMTCRF